MSDFVVACPECGTQFRVTAAQLAPARGIVRCGACLAVFRAEDSRVGGPAGAPADGAGDGGAAAHARRHRSVLAREQQLPEDEEARPEAERSPARAPARAPAQTPDRSRQGVHEPVPERIADRPRTPTLDVTEPGAREQFEPAAAQRRRPRATRAGWWAAVLLLVSVGAAELVWLRLDVLLEDPRSRPWLVRLCESVGCTLPVRSDVGAIRSRSLLVRSHPERRDGLRVDAVIVNRAPWPQAFPLVELRFSDIQGRLVAARRFAAAEYLAGELAGRREMPVATPVQISFDLLDPGPEAVNYEMRLYAEEDGP